MAASGRVRLSGLAAGESIVVSYKMLEGAEIRIVRDEVTRVDAAGKGIAVSNDETFGYGGLFLAPAAGRFHRLGGRSGASCY